MIRSRRKFLKVLSTAAAVPTFSIGANAAPTAPGIAISTAYFGFVPSAPPKYAHAPGSLVRIFGENLSAATFEASSKPWEEPWQAAIDGVSVSINGRKAPLQFISPSQIDAQVPFETELGEAELAVTNPDGRKTLPIAIAARSPWPFGHGTGFASAQHSPARGPALSDPLVGLDPDSPANPADLIRLYFTGGGQGSIEVATGDVNPGEIRDPDQLSLLPNPTIQLLRRTPDGIEMIDAAVEAAAKAPNFIGLDQVTFWLPQELQTGIYTIELIMDERGTAAVDLPVVRDATPYASGRVTTIGKDFSRLTIVTLGGERTSPSARGHWLNDRTTTSEQTLDVKIEGDDLYGYNGKITVPAGETVRLQPLFAIPKHKDASLKYRLDPYAKREAGKDLALTHFTPDVANDLDLLDLLHFTAIWDKIVMLRSESPTKLWRWNEGWEDYLLRRQDKDLHRHHL